MTTELKELYDELHEKHYSEVDRQNHTTWAIFDLINVIKSITKRQDVHDKLEEIRQEMLKNG